jgi:enterochelin esterase-like enzyme
MNRARLWSVVSGLVCVFAASSLLHARQSAAPASAPTPASAPASQAATAGGRGGGPVKSPEIGADNRVTFRFRGPNAKEVGVQVSGKRLPMQKDEAGVWSVTTDPLTPDIYTYSLVVDGATMNDPANRQVQTSFGSFSSMFMMPGPQPWLPQAGVARGAITRHAFHSAVANDDRDFFVYTPAGYDAHRAQPYPVLFLLHGLGDDAERWMNGGGGAHNILDNLIAQNKAVPMVMVTTLGYGTSTGPAGGRGPENILGYEKILLSEVMPMVDKAYNVSRNREQRAIAGLSMGGAESLYVGLRNLDKFAWIGAYSSAQLLWPGVAMQPAPPAPPAPTPAPADAAGRGGRGGGAPQLIEVSSLEKVFPNLDAKANKQIKMLWIVCGTADGLIVQNRQFKDWLKSKGVDFTEQEVPDMAHVWPLWRQNLSDMAPRLFQPKGK